MPERRAVWSGDQQTARSGVSFGERLVARVVVRDKSHIVGWCMVLVVLAGCAGVKPRAQVDLPYPNYRVPVAVGVVIDPALATYERRQPKFEVFERSGVWERNFEVKPGSGPSFELGEGLVGTLKAAVQESFGSVTFLDEMPQVAVVDPAGPQVYLVLQMDPSADIQIQIVDGEVAAGFMKRMPFDGTKAAVRVRAEVRRADGAVVWGGTVRGKGLARGRGRYRDAAERALKDVALRLRQALVMAPEIVALSATLNNAEQKGTWNNTEESAEESAEQDAEKAKRLSVEAVNAAIAHGRSASSVEAVVGEWRFGEERLGATHGIALTPRQQIALYVADQSGAAIEPDVIKVLTLREWNQLLVLATVYGDSLTFADAVTVQLEQGGRAINPMKFDRQGFAVPTEQYPDQPAYRTTLVAGFAPDAVDLAQPVEVLVACDGAEEERWPLLRGVSE